MVTCTVILMTTRNNLLLRFIIAQQIPKDQIDHSEYI